MEAGCSTAYAGSYIAIASTFPFAVTMDRSVGAGYSETICVKCERTTYGVASQTYDNYVVTQTAKPCFTSLSAKVPTPSNPTFPFNSAPGTESLMGWADIIVNSESGSCDPNSCTLLA